MNAEEVWEHALRVAKTVGVFMDTKDKPPEEVVKALQAAGCTNKDVTAAHEFIKNEVEEQRRG